MFTISSSHFRAVEQDGDVGALGHEVAHVEHLRACICLPMGCSRDLGAEPSAPNGGRTGTRECVPDLGVVPLSDSGVVPSC